MDESFFIEYDIADINECEFENQNDCHMNSTCTDTDGSYQCTCDIGFSGNGVNCSDIDECIANQSDCDPNARCANNVGSYDCFCLPGYAGNGFICEGIFKGKGS